MSTIYLKEELEVRLLFELPKHIAQIEAVKQVRQMTGVDFSPALINAPAQQNILPTEEMLEPTDLGKALNIGSGRAVNNLLASLGVQTKLNGYWEPTSIVPNRMFSKHSWNKKGKSGYNLKWNLSYIKNLLDAK